MGVWSDGPSLEQSVERHLFEPFFSSDNQSTGLGLYICRALCEGHGAAISYQRVQRSVQGVSVEGNEFLIAFRSDPQQTVKSEPQGVETLGQAF
jgi:two-component system, NtrC family, sensor histidine kinase PilS